MNNEDSSEKILGIDKKILIEFLKLFRDKYRVADMANYHLERTGMSGINIAIVNQRDALSHFCTLLADKNLSPNEQIGQLYAAEEHMRRAVVESYQKAFSLKLIDVYDLYEKYKRHVVPCQKSYKPLASTPSITEIKGKLKEISNLGKKGRSVKARNKWDEEWEEGVKDYYEAYIKTTELEDALENYLSLASQMPWFKNTKIKVLIGIALCSILLNIVFLIRLIT